MPCDGGGSTKVAGDVVALGMEGLKIDFHRRREQPHNIETALAVCVPFGEPEQLL